jgi:uncharacterized phage-like protein YoqJ
MIIAATGHRPNKLGGYNQKSFNKLYKIAYHWLKENKPTKCISGMALGWDQAFAAASLELGIPLIAAIPCKNQDALWYLSNRNFYKKLLKHKLCNKIVVNNIPFQIWVMQKRNEWMVDHCDKVLAMWDGSTGGTFNCIKYAKAKNIEVINLIKKLPYA